jgi:hypothetical protein
LTEIGKTLAINENPRTYYPRVNSRRLVEFYLNDIYKKVHNEDFNRLDMWVGRHRVGKSTNAIVFAHLLDKTFKENFEDRIVYSAEQFMYALEIIRKKEIIGGAVIWDEAGVGLPSREWYAVSNKAINYALQTLGYLRPIIYFVAPDISYVDSQVRKLFHAFYEVNRSTKEYSIIKPFTLSYDKKTGKIYYIYPKYLRRHRQGIYGNTIVPVRFVIPYPPNWILQRYEEHSKPWKDAIQERMQKLAKSVHHEGSHFANMTNDERAAWLKENYDTHPDLVREQKVGSVKFDQDMVKDLMGVTFREARIVAKKTEGMISKDVFDSYGKKKEHVETDKGESLSADDFSII